MSEQVPPPPTEAAFFATIRSWGLTRGDHGIVGGVIEGVGDRIGLARVPARLIFIVIAIFTSGIAALAYAAGWALLPDRRGNIIIQNFGRGITNVGALLGIALLTLIGLGNFRITFPFAWGAWPWEDGWSVGNTFAVVWTLVIVGSIAWLVIALIQRSRSGAAAVPPQPSPSAGAGATASTSPDGAAAPVYAALPGEAGPIAAATAAAGTAGDAERQAWDAQQQAQQQAWQAQQEAQREAQQQAWEAERQARAAAAEARRRSVVPGPGAAGYLTALAWLILSGVGVWVAARNDLLAVHPWVAWPVAVLIGWGVILMVVSLLGRRLGFLGVLTVLGIVPVLLIGSVADSLRSHWDDDGGILPHWEIEDEDQFEENVKTGIESWVQEHIDPDFDIDEQESGSTDDAVDAAPSPGPNATVSPLAAFDDYPEVLLRGDCFAADTVSWSEGSEVEHLALGSLSSDRELSLSSAVTSLTIPSGTQLRIVAEDGQPLDVEWADRDLACELTGTDTTVAALGDDEDQPTLTLIAQNGADMIVIHETEE